MDREKELTLGGRRFVLRRLSAQKGSFIYLRLLGSLLRARRDGKTASSSPEVTPVELTMEERASALVTLAVAGDLSEEDAANMFNASLQVVDVRESVKGVEARTPLFSDDGRCSVPEIGDDPALLQRLMMASLAFSLSPYFAVIS